MLIELDPAITANEVQSLERRLSGMGLDVLSIETRSYKCIACSKVAGAGSVASNDSSSGKAGKVIRFPSFESDVLSGMPSSDQELIASLREHSRVVEVYPILDGHKLVSKRWKSTDSTVPVGGGNVIGGGSLSLIFGPCAIEGEVQTSETLRLLSDLGIRYVRGGAFKPRTSAYSFRGHGLEGLKMFSRLAREFNIRVVSEVLSPRQIEGMYEYVDVFQVGARNSQNFSLLHELGKVRKPVLLKRGLAGTVDELLHSAEHVFSSGNQDIILCERGIRSCEPRYRNTLDLNAVAFLKRHTHLPVIVDPSHGTGDSKLVEPLALAAIMAGADGLLVEIHNKPNQALSDGSQALRFEQASDLAERARQVFELRKSFKHKDAGEELSTRESVRSN